FTPEQERLFLQACDDWQFPIFLTLMLTGLRPGELTHLLLPDDLDLDKSLLRVRNKPALGWQVKTRKERDIPLLSVLGEVLRRHLGNRFKGPVFFRRRWQRRYDGLDWSRAHWEEELERRAQARYEASGGPISACDHSRIARRLWREMGIVREDRIRGEFM